MPLSLSPTRMGLSFFRHPRKLFLLAGCLGLSVRGQAALPTCNSAIFKRADPRFEWGPVQSNTLAMAHTVFQIAKGAKIHPDDPIRSFLTQTADRNSQEIRKAFPVHHNPLNRWVGDAVLFSFGETSGAHAFYVVAPLRGTAAIVSVIVAWPPGTSPEVLEPVLIKIWSNVAHGVQRSGSAWLKRSHPEFDQPSAGTDQDPDLDRFRPLYYGDGSHALALLLVLDPRKMSVSEFDRFLFRMLTGPEETIH